MKARTAATTKTIPTERLVPMLILIMVVSETHLKIKMMMDSKHFYKTVNRKYFHNTTTVSINIFMPFLFFV